MANNATAISMPSSLPPRRVRCNRSDRQAEDHVDEVRPKKSKKKKSRDCTTDATKINNQNSLHVSFHLQSDLSFEIICCMAVYCSVCVRARARAHTLASRPAPAERRKILSSCQSQVFFLCRSRSHTLRCQYSTHLVRSPSLASTQLIFT